MNVLYDKTTMVDHAFWITPLYCQYDKDEFVILMMCIENIAAIMFLQ